MLGLNESEFRDTVTVEAPLGLTWEAMLAVPSNLPSFPGVEWLYFDANGENVMGEDARIGFCIGAVGVRGEVTIKEVDEANFALSAVVSGTLLNGDLKASFSKNEENGTLVEGSINLNCSQWVLPSRKMLLRALSAGCKIPVSKALAQRANSLGVD